MRSNAHFRLLTVTFALVLGIAACGGGGDNDAGDNGTSGEETPSESEATGGTLNVGVNVDVQRWDSSRVQSILFPYTRQLYDSLITYDDDLNPVPALATEWAISDDFTAVTITLREDVVFHSGRELTAEDVAANLEAFADPELGNQQFGPMSVVDTWEVVDDLTLEVAFTQPLAELQINDLLQAWTIGDPEIFDQYDSRGEGTGPFKFVEWVPGERVTLEANPDYWGDGPYLDGIEYRIFGDSDAMIAGLESGVVDAAISVPTADAQRLQGDYTVLEGYSGALVDHWEINPTSPPFDNVDVRQAIGYATDREAIMEALYFGFGTPSALPFGLASPAYDAGLNDSLGYDLDRARQLLESSGLSEDELQAQVLVNSSNPAAEGASQILQAALGEIGFTLELEVRDSTESTERQLAGDFQIVFTAIGNAQKYPTRITTNSTYRIADHKFDVPALFPDYPPAVEAANAAVTPEDQEATFAELNRVIIESGWTQTIGIRPYLLLVDPDISGVNRNVDNMALFHEARINR